MRIADATATVVKIYHTVMNHTTTAFAHAVLAKIHAPHTEANVKSMVAWIHREGGGGKNNPLNTSYHMPGASVFNQYGVRNYKTWSDGIQATTFTLTNGMYPELLYRFRTGLGICGYQTTELGIWSGNGYDVIHC